MEDSTTKKSRVIGWLESPQAIWWFAVPFALESFIIFPLDILIALFSLKKDRPTWQYITVGAVASTAGAAIGYFIGAIAWETIGQRMISLVASAERFNTLTYWYARQHGPVIFITGLLPLPFKLFTISAGFCKLPLASFMFFIFLTRLSRYYLVALVSRRWGGQVVQFINRLSPKVLFSVAVQVCLVMSFAWVLC